MKPLQIGLLVAAGAIGGALVMKWQSTRQATPPVVSATGPAAVTSPAVPAASPAAPTDTAAEPATPAEVQPSPFPEKNKEPRHKSHAAHEAKEAPAAVAQNKPPAAEPAPAPQAATPAPAAEPAANPTPAQPPFRPAPEPVPTEPPAPPPPPKVTLAAGTLIPVRLVEGLSTDRNQPGDQFTATLDAPLIVDGFVIAERGARLEGKVVESVKAGKVKGVSSLGIELSRLSTSDGQHVTIQTETFTKTGPTTKGEDAAKVGVGAGIGAAIGAIAGGGKGAGIGAALGGAAGAGDVLMTRGKPAAIATETRINFRLRNSVNLTEQRR